MFNEICIYEAKIDKQEKIEELCLVHNKGTESCN